jgi:hypothetical protein
VLDGIREKLPASIKTMKILKDKSFKKICKKFLKTPVYIKFSKRDFIAISILLLLGFMYMYFLNSAPINKLGGDQIIYNRLALNLLQGNGFSQHINPPFLPSIIRTPLFPLFLSFIYKFFGINNYEAVRFFQILLMLTSSLISFFIAYIVFGNKIIAYISLIFCLFYDFDYSNYGVYAYLLSEPLTIFFINLGVLYSVLLFKYDKYGYYFLCGSFFSFAILTRPSNLLYPVILIFVIFYYKVFNKETIKKVIIFCASVTIFLLPWIIRNYICFKKIIISASFIGILIFSGSIVVNPDFFPYPDSSDTDYRKNCISISSRDLEVARNEMSSWFNIHSGGGGIEIYDHDNELKKIGLKIIKQNYFDFMKRWSYRILGHWNLADLANIISGVDRKLSFLVVSKIFLKVIIALIVLFSILKNYKNQLVILLLLFPLYNTLFYTFYCGFIRYSLVSRSLVLIVFAAGIYGLWSICFSKLKMILKSH